MIAERSHMDYLLGLLGIFLLLLAQVSPAVAGEPLSFSGSWNYRENGGDNIERNQFNQSYSLTYSKELSEAMNFTGSVRYSENKPSDTADSSSLNPSMALDLRNEFLSLNLNASALQTEREGAATRDTNAWGANLSSHVEHWPSVRLYLSRSDSTDDRQPQEVDSESTTIGGSIEYGWQPFDFLYDARQSNSTDQIERSESEVFDQTAQVRYEQSFFAGRVSVSAAQQFQITENSTETRVGAGNAFDAPLQTVNRYYVEDNNPVTAPLGTVSFEDVNLLAVTDDKNLSLEVSSILVNGQLVNFFNKLKVWLYSETAGLRGPLAGLELPLVTNSADWRVYHRNFGDLTWQLVAPLDYSFSFAEELLNGNRRTAVTFDLNNNITADYVKVVFAATSPVREAFVDDFIAYYADIATTELLLQTRDTESMQSQLSTTVRLTDKWSLSYSLRRAEIRQDTGDTVQFNHSLTSSYSVSERLGFSFGVAENRDENENSADRENRSYSVSMSAQPLAAVNFSLGFTRSENDSDDGQETVSDSLSSTLSAAIYPDLTASMSTNWSQSENLAEGTESNTYGVALNTTAYLSPKLDLNTNINYSETDSSSGEDSRSARYGLTLGYRPSDALLFNFNYDADVESGDSTLSGSSNWLWSRKLQSQAGFSFDFGDETTQQYNALLSWTISRSLSLQTSGNFLRADEGDSWDLYTSLNLIF